MQILRPEGGLRRTTLLPPFGISHLRGSGVHHFGWADGPIPTQNDGAGQGSSAGKVNPGSSPQKRIPMRRESAAGQQAAGNKKPTVPHQQTAQTRPARSMEKPRQVRYFIFFSGTLTLSPPYRSTCRVVGRSASVLEVGGWAVLGIPCTAGGRKGWGDGVRSPCMLPFIFW
jgi:hypothetical protein